MSKGSNGTQTVVNQTQLPQWVQNAAQNNLNASYNVANNMMGPYTGQRVADMTGNQLQDINAVQNNLGSSQPAYAAAQGTAAGVSNYTPNTVTPGTLAGANLSQYMNPYTQNVINSGLNALDIQRQQALNQIGDQATAAGAFGGSRQGVQEGVTNAGAALQAGNLAAQLQQQNYSQAVGQAQTDIQNNMNAQLANQQAGLQGAGVNLAGANALGSLAGQGQSSFLQGAGAALSGQEGLQNQNQNVLNANQAQYAAEQQFPLQQLQVPLQALGMTPYGSTSTSTSTATPNYGLTALGGLGVGAQIGNMTGIGSGLGSLGGLGLALLSDRNEKTDIKKVGKDPRTGLDLYAYRYKDDPKSYPKVVGPMAQDIEKKYPDAVRKVGGKRVIGNLGFGVRA